MKKTLLWVFGIVLIVALATVVIVSMLNLSLFRGDRFKPPAHTIANEKEKQEVITQYPDDVLSAMNDAGEYHTVTVEMAIEDLREHSDHPCLENGIIAFDGLTFSYPDVDKVRGTFWFIITTSENDDSTTYYARVPYCRIGDNYDNDDTNDRFILESANIELRDHEIGGW